MDSHRPAASFVDPELTDSFNAANLWRVETILRLGLAGESRWTAANPGLAFPQFLDFLTRAISEAPEGTVVDLGAGLGGVSEAVRRSTRRTVIACDADVKCGAGTLRLFPEVTAAAAVPSSLPVRDGSVAACYSCGVFSLLEDPRRMLVEAGRVLRPGGRFVLIDVTSASRDDVTVGSGSYPSAERLLQVV